MKNNTTSCQFHQIWRKSLQSRMSPHSEVCWKRFRKCPCRNLRVKSSKWSCRLQSITRRLHQRRNSVFGIKRWETLWSFMRLLRTLKRLSLDTFVISSVWGTRDKLWKLELFLIFLWDDCVSRDGRVARWQETVPTWLTSTGNVTDVWFLIEFFHDIFYYDLTFWIVVFFRICDPSYFAFDSRSKFSLHPLLRDDILKHCLSLQLETSPKCMLISFCVLWQSECVTIEVSCWYYLNMYWVICYCLPHPVFLVNTTNQFLLPCVNITYSIVIFYFISDYIKYSGIVRN